MQRVMGDREDERAQMRQLTALVARVRWAGVALGVSQALLTSDPAPLLGVAGMLVPALLMIGYNVPAACIRRLPASWVPAIASTALAGDFLVVTSWTMLTANDVYSTSYAAYALVAIEAAVLFRWRGATGFIVAFAAAYCGFYWFRDALFGFTPTVGSVLYRTGIIVLVAVFVGVLTQASERRRQRYEMLLQAISEMGEGLIITEAGKLVACNPAYERITGYTKEQLGELPTLVELAVEDRRLALMRRLGDRLAGRQVVTQYESALRHRDGHIVDVESVIRPLPAEGQDRLIAVVRDITERKRAQEELQRSERRAHLAARLDALTGVANRRAWDEELELAMDEARGDGTPLTIALLDLDNFKTYNDDWGHVRGDELLCSYARAWREPLRQSDVLARYGGDEFSVLMRATGLTQAAVVVDRLRSAAAALPSFSVGIAVWDGEETGGALLARADAALYGSKRAGPGRVRAAEEHSADEPGFSFLIPRLLARQDLDAVYQSIHRLGTLDVIGHEALARPGGFAARASVEGLFDAAKRLGFARDLDWLCRRVAVQSATLLPADELLFINASIHALLDPLHDVDQMLLLMRWAGRDPATVVFEISERDKVTDLARLRSVVSEYRAEGFRFALDDVGEGHSTLEVLAATRPEFIKIARSLAVNVETPGARSAVQALVTFADSSGADLVAEGLETEAQIEGVRALGVLYGQGYALSLPQPVRAAGADQDTGRVLQPLRGPWHRAAAAVDGVG